MLTNAEAQRALPPSYEEALTVEHPAFQQQQQQERVLSRNAVLPITGFPLSVSAVVVAEAASLPNAVDADSLPSYDSAAAVAGEKGFATSSNEKATQKTPTVAGAASSSTGRASLPPAEVIIEGEPPKLYHLVTPQDTLVGISMRYGIPVDKIRTANRMFGTNIHERERLLIPGISSMPKNSTEVQDEYVIERHRQRMAKRFQLATKCVDPAEVKMYMDQHGEDIDAAVRHYLDDLEWEKSHPFKE